MSNFCTDILPTLFPVIHALTDEIVNVREIKDILYITNRAGYGILLKESQDSITFLSYDEIRDLMELQPYLKLIHDIISL